MPRGAHEGGALDFGRGGLSAASSKLGETAAPGCHGRTAPLGSCTSAPRTWGWSGPGFALGRTQNLLPTHVGMDQLPARLGRDLPFPTHVGSPRLGVVSVPGSRE